MRASKLMLLTCASGGLHAMTMDSEKCYRPIGEVVSASLLAEQEKRVIGCLLAAQLDQPFRRALNW
jgi:hypothetical protein